MKRFALLASGLTLSLAACNSSEGNVTTSPSNNLVTTPTVAVTLPATKVDTSALNGSTVDAAASRAAVASATQGAQDAFQAVFDSASGDMTNPMGSQAGAMANANAQMRLAFQKDPNNTQACFGLAVTSLAVRTQSLGETMGKLQDQGLDVSNPVSAGRGQAALPSLARAMANPTEAPSITALQDSINDKLFPTLDSAIFLLQKAWKDPDFAFKVADPDFAGDSLVIDRGDVGFALAGLKGLRGYISWMVSYNADVRKDGSYSWIDTLGNIDGDAPSTVAQKAAFDHVKGLVAANSSFLKVRSGKEELLGSVVPQFREALAVAKEAASMSYELKHGAIDRRLTTITTTSQRDKVIKAADTALSWLAGPRTVTLMKLSTCKETYTSTSTSNYVYDSIKDTYTYSATPVTTTSTSSYSWTRHNLFGLSSSDCGSGYSYTGTSYSYSSTYTEIGGTTVQTRFDLSALLRLSDLKAFLPNSYVWNDYSAWKAKGPFSLSNGSTTKTIKEVSELTDAKGIVGIKGWLRWSDPTFGGTFPDLTTSEALIDLVNRMDGGSTASAGRIGTAFSLLR